MKSDKVLVAIVCALVIWADTGLSHTTSETNRVVRSMLLRASDFWISLSHLDDSVLNWPTTPETWDGFLHLGINEGWTLKEKESAFDWYLESMSNSNLVSASQRDKNLLSAAMTECKTHCRTNSFPPLARITVRADGGLREDAIDASIKCAPFDESLLSFTENIATNFAIFTPKERSLGLVSLKDKLGAVPVNADMTNKVINLYYRLRNDRYNSICCDGVLTNRLDGYAMSSNRLDVALGMLSLTNMHPWFVTYYVGVTNELLSSGQPLRRINVGGNE